MQITFTSDVNLGSFKYEAGRSYDVDKPIADRFIAQGVARAAAGDGDDALALNAGLPDLVQAGAVVTDSMVPWTPTMGNARFWYDSADVLNGAGQPAGGGDDIFSWPNRITTAVSRTTGGALTLLPYSTNLGAGSAANCPQRATLASGAALNGIRPARFGGSVGKTASRMATPQGALSSTGPYRLVMLVVLRGTSAACLAGISNTNGVTILSTGTTRNLRTGTDAQGFGSYTDETAILLTIDRPGTEKVFDNAVSPTSLVGRINGAASTTQGTGATSTSSTDRALIIGNAWDVDTQCANMDVYGIIGFEGPTTDAEIWRAEAYLAHRFGQATLLPGDHPYRDGPPMVPAGTTANAMYDLAVNNRGKRQVMYGYIAEIADGNIADSDGGQGSDPSRRVFFGLNSAERTKLAEAVRGIYGIRQALGIYYRGLRNIDGTSSLAKNIGPEYNEQRRYWFEHLAAAGGAVLLPEYWSPAPHWKTTSAFANGTLWAGAAYSRATTLDSIRGTDATQYNAQIAAFTDAIVNDLEDLHTHPVYPMRVAQFGLQNEPLGTPASYGSCSYTAQLYLDVMKALVPKIRNSTKLSSWAGQPQTVAIHANSWDGPGGSIANAIIGDATVLSTGKTISQEIAYWTYHRIAEQNADPNSSITGNGTNSDATGLPYYNHRRTATNPLLIPTACNEYESFQSPVLTREQWFANLIMVFLNTMNYMQAPVVSLIHLAKPVTDPNTQWYAIFGFRDSTMTPASVDYFAGSEVGRLVEITHNFNATRLFIRRLKGAQYLFVQSQAYSPTARVGGWETADGKLIVCMLNNSASPQTISCNIGAQARTLRPVLYSATVRDQYFGDSRRSNVFSATVPAYSMVAWIEP